MKKFMRTVYICECGEQVTVIRYELGVQFENPPMEVTRECPNGHRKTIRVFENMGNFLNIVETELEPGEQTHKIQ
jgi:hypothetical protein